MTTEDPTGIADEPRTCDATNARQADGPDADDAADGHASPGRSHAGDSSRAEDSSHADDPSDAAGPTDNEAWLEVALGDIPERSWMTEPFEFG